MYFLALSKIPKLFESFYFTQVICLMNNNLSSMITPKNLVKDNLSRVMSLRSKGVVTLDHLTMTLCLYARLRFRPRSLLDKEVMAPCGYSVPCQLRPVVRRQGREVP